ncbi:hypothetical protein BN7_3835 [Wickerhamomyces ciferrii]|uniref:Pre-mRNA-splicing factor CLF1 n=1 Tax=Wickerhamomyces ciferrii (strain ATCC 14091 / BCRC 22168 / CBS 111 / JCM 3599 / NBRC 0793 / NRRL Y-1031 F-60-10) TaxID=1206466 RepID=K0KSH4_WICCF|nr:uncharacterized protein BN7_3835 [Wickerhamomyces ciferrii]CCH44274.1 hypothetical protein BN7_3835 [Wickerhamomyces ciferrii]
MEKNRTPAEFQISAEQILLEAYERKDEPLNKTKVNIADLEELHEAQRRQRQEYEDALRRNRLDFGQWMRYAQYEVDQKDLRRARSIFERALEINSHHVPLWIRYIDTELKSRNINHARNLFDRAVTLLPRIDKLWFRYVQTEETLANIIGTRNVFNRWMQWQPDVPAWDAYINFEKRYDEFDNVRKIFNQYINVHPYPETWIKWTKFEDEFGTSDNVREVYTASIDVLSSEKLIASFAKWEGFQKEWERARAIYRFGLTKFPESALLNDQLSQFEKQYGDKDGIEDTILLKRKKRYESELKEDPRDFDSWWAYLTLLEDYPVSVQREAFEKSISLTPIEIEKYAWKRYILLWIRYAVFEELNDEFEKTRDIYKKLTKIIPNKKFTFSKVWIQYSDFEIRQGNLTQARKILGFAIGSFPKPKTFKHYIQLEIKLKEFDRVRKIYEKFIETYPNDSNVWIKYAELEADLNDLDRSRGILEIATEQLNGTDSINDIWFKYVEIESDQREYGKARSIFKRFLESNKNSTTIWIKYALFELGIPTKEQIDQFEKEQANQDEELEFEFDISEESKTRTRQVFEDSLTHFKSQGLKDERVIILEAFKKFEQVHGDPTTISKIEKRQPTVVKKTKTLDDGSTQEYYDYVFPDDKKLSKFLENAKKWAKQNK